MNSSIADLAILGRLFDEHRPKLLAMVEQRLDRSLSARVSGEDILQDAFEIARTKWPEFLRRQRSASGIDRTQSEFWWLYRAALDALINAWRKHSSGPRDVRLEMPLPESSAMQLGYGLIGQEPGPATRLQQDELQDLVQQAMLKLEDSDRKILWMRHADQLTIGEISEVLEISENAASLRYMRAQERLQKSWHELNPDFGSTL